MRTYPVPGRFDASVDPTDARNTPVLEDLHLRPEPFPACHQRGWSGGTWAWTGEPLPEHCSGRPRA